MNWLRTLNWGVGIAVFLIAVIFIPLAIINPPIMDNQWNETVYQNPHLSDGSGGPGTGFWYVLGICVLVTIGMLIWMCIAPEPVTDDSELFERYDGRR